MSVERLILDCALQETSMTESAEAMGSKNVVQRLENWDIDDADSEELYALLADAARELKNLQQFHDWASPQVHDHGLDVLEIARLRDELTAANLDLATAKLLIGRIDEVAAFPVDGADIGRKVRLHNIRDKISIYRRDDRGPR